MPTVAVFSPGLHGHRQTYCRVLAQILLSDGLDVVVVAGVDEASRGSAGSAAPQLRTLEDVDRYRFVGLPAAGMPLLQRSPRGFLKLLDDVDADAVLLTEADACVRLLNSRIAHRGRPRRWVGLFIRNTNYVHEPRRNERPRVTAALAGARHTGHRLRRWARDARLFHETLMPKLHLLDAALYLDEGFVADHPQSALWLPDIFTPRPWAVGLDAEETRFAALGLEAFLKQQGDRPVYAYLGSPQERRGYGTLLELAVAAGGCVIHCGRAGGDAPGSEGVEVARQELLRRDALFELGAYYESDSTADLFLERTATVVLPYRGHLGSSGVMLQALAAGRPVLVPDQGLMAQRVRRFGLGRTYRCNDWDDLRRQDRALRAEGARPYAASIEAFMALFSREQTEDALRGAMGYGRTTVRSPVPRAAERGD